MDVVVFAVMFLEVAGSPSVEEFSVLMTGTATTAEATSILRQISESGGKLLSRWSEVVANTSSASRLKKTLGPY